MLDKHTRNTTNTGVIIQSRGLRAIGLKNANGANAATVPLSLSHSFRARLQFFDGNRL